MVDARAGACSIVKAVRQCTASHFGSRQCVFNNGTRNDDCQVLRRVFRIVMQDGMICIFMVFTVCFHDTKHLHEKIFGDSSESRRNQKNVMKKVGLEWSVNRIVKEDLRKLGLRGPFRDSDMRGQFKKKGYNGHQH